MPKSVPAKAARKSVAKKTAVVKKPARKVAPKAAAKSPAGKLPEWNLADLYTSITAPEIARDRKSVV